MAEITIFDVLRVFILFSTPIILTGGLLLLFLDKDTYSKLEEKLGQEIWGIKKRVSPRIETNIYTFHNWMLKEKKIAAPVFIASALAIFLLNR